MQNQKRALSTAAIGIAVVALLMVAFYGFKNRLRKADGEETVAASAEGENLLPETRSEFAGLYAATDGAMEAGERRITSFLVATNDGGGLIGSAKIDTVGSSEPVKVNCLDVRIEGQEFFLKCQDPAEGMISLNGAWAKDAKGSVTVAGKVLWEKDGALLLDVARNFQLLPAQ